MKIKQFQIKKLKIMFSRKIYLAVINALIWCKLHQFSSLKNDVL